MERLETTHSYWKKYCIFFFFLMQGSFSSPERHFFHYIFDYGFIPLLTFKFLLNTLVRQIFVLRENMGVTVIKFIKVFPII